MRLLRLLAASALLAIAAGPAPALASPALARGDALWDRRAEGHAGGRAQPEPIGSAIEAYRQALRDAPDDLEAHWKLQRALWFAGRFAARDGAAERERYEQAIAVGEDGLRALAGRVGGRDALDAASPEALREQLPANERSDAARLSFWHALSLGAWAQRAGLLQAVRAGVANRMHDATLRSIMLDPDVEQGGATRLLSRLHAELPKVPFFSGWVDPARALPLAEQVARAHPAHPGNQLLLGLTLLERDPGRREEALARLERAATLEPRADQIVEDLAIRGDARERLEAERGTGAGDVSPSR